MNKKLTNIFLLSFASLALFGCNSATSDDTTPSEPATPTTEMEEHLQKGTLHDVKVQESTRPFVQNGKSDYKIYYEASDEFAQKAATFMATQIEMATGLLLPVAERPSELTDDHFILLGDNQYQASKNIPVSEKDIGTSGYQIYTKDNACYIRVGGELGFQQAAIAFLKATIGYNRYSGKIVTYTKDGSTLPDMDIVERPDFDFRTQSNKVETSTSYEMGFLTLAETFYMDSETQPFHNSFNYLPPATYKEKHPYWYSDKGDQICYTAHGDEAEYKAMLEEVYGKMVTRLAKNKTVGAVTFSIEDTPNACACDACKANVAKYGADSGSVVKFLNALDDKLQAHLEEEAKRMNTPKRELNVIFFAYHRTEKPCVTKNADGTFTPNSPDVICNPHVGPYIAPISACFTKSFYNDDNSDYADSIKGWGALSNKLYIWLYETNFSHYLYPLNSYSTMIESYRFAYENHGMYMFNEGQHNQGAVTCFGRFKEYLNSVSLFDVNSDYDTIVNDFFENYFREGGVAMKRYFQELQEQCAYIEQVYSYDINGTIYNNIAQQQYWPKKLLDRWNGYIEEAKEAILPYQKSNRLLYDTLMDNILLESMFPRYALLNHYSGKYSADTLNALRRSFKTDCQRVNVTMLNENQTMDSVFSSWGL